MAMRRQFPDRGLDYTTPHKYSNVWWQVIMWLSVTCIRDRNSVRMVSCTIGNSIMCNTTVSSTGVNSTAVTAHVHWQTVLMITCSIDARYVAVRRQFPDSLLCCSAPTINRYIRLQVIVRRIRASVTNCYCMSMLTSLFSCFCALIRTPWSWSRFRTTCVVFFYKSKSMRVISACTNRYIVVMFRQFSDRKIRKDW